MYSHVFFLFTFCQLVISSADGSSVGLIKSSTDNATKSTVTYVFQSGYKVYPGIGVLKFHNVLLDWNDARETCIREGAHLAVINSAFEESTIAAYQAVNNIDSFWIGIHDQFKSRNWVTVLDQPIKTVGYEHWNSGEPSNSGGNEHCVAYEKTGFNDLNCSQKRMFICKMYLN